MLEFSVGYHWSYLGINSTAGLCLCGCNDLIVCWTNTQALPVSLTSWAKFGSNSGMVSHLSGDEYTCYPQQNDGKNVCFVISYFFNEMCFQLIGVKFAILSLANHLPVCECDPRQKRPHYWNKHKLKSPISQPPLKMLTFPFSISTKANYSN